MVVQCAVFQVAHAAAFFVPNFAIFVSRRSSSLHIAPGNHNQIPLFLCFFLQPDILSDPNQRLYVRCQHKGCSVPIMRFTDPPHCSDCAARIRTAARADKIAASKRLVVVDAPSKSKDKPKKSALDVASLESDELSDLVARAQAELARQTGSGDDEGDDDAEDSDCDDDDDDDDDTHAQPHRRLSAPRSTSLPLRD